MTILVKALGAALMFLPIGILVNGYKLRVAPSPVEITDTSLMVSERSRSTAAIEADSLIDEETSGEANGLFSSIEIRNSWDAHPADCWCIWNNNESYISSPAGVSDSNQADKELTLMQK
jgi:hypothetical protein